MSPTSNYPNSQPGRESRAPRHASRSVPLVSRSHGGYGAAGNAGNTGAPAGEPARHMAPIVVREPARGRVASEDDLYRDERRSGRDAREGRSASDDAAGDGRRSRRRDGRAPRVVPRASAASNPSPVSVAMAWVGRHRILTGVVVTIVVVAALLYAPLKAYYVAERTNAILDERLAAVTSTNDELQGEVDNLMTQEGIEDEARRRGYVKDGETGVDMAGVDDAGSATTDGTVGQDASPDGQELPWYTDLLDFIFQYDADTQGVPQNGQ